MKAPTPRQRTVLETIAELVERQGYAPSIRELASALGVNSTTAVTDHLYRLKALGLVVWQPNKGRTLRLTPAALSLLAHAKGQEAHAANRISAPLALNKSTSLTSAPTASEQIWRPAMGSVRISEKSARSLLDFARAADEPSLDRATAELDRTLQPKRSVVAHAKRVRAKKRTKNEETSAIYEELEARANGHCELCGAWFSGSDRAEMHHAFGRVRVPQSAGNCLLIHRTCHGRLTRNEPSAEDCWRQVKEAFRRLDLQPSRVLAWKQEIHFREKREHREAIDAKAKAANALRMTDEAAKVSAGGGR